MSTPKPSPPVQTTEALAETLGLSRWTVSRALNGQPGVSSATREKVVAAMAQAGFSPNPLARGLRGGKTGTVGTVFQEIESPILAKKTAALQDALRERGQRGVIELTGGDTTREAEAIRHLLGWQVDGLVLANATLAPDDPLVQQLAASAIPTVLIDPAHPLPLPTVRLDRIFAMRQVISYLHGLGHQRFCLAGFPNDRYFEPIRHEGLRKGAVDCGLDFAQAFTAISHPAFRDQDYGYGAALADAFIRLEPRPTAVMALNDRIAVGLQHALREAHNLRAPRDFSIIGFDDLDVSAWLEPALSTVNQQIPLVMQTAVNLLETATAMPPDERAQEHLIRPILKKRGSTAAPPR